MLGEFLQQRMLAKCLALGFFGRFTRRLRFFATALGEQSFQALQILPLPIELLRRQIAVCALMSSARIGWLSSSCSIIAISAASRLAFQLQSPALRFADARQSAIRASGLPVVHRQLRVGEPAPD